MESRKIINTLTIFCFFFIIFSTTITYASNRSFNSSTFDDVKGSHWFYNGVKAAYENNYMDGKGNGKFEPNDNLTLAEAITITARMYAINKNETIDISNANTWYQPYVLYAKKNNLLSNSMLKANTDFSLNATRSQSSYLFNQVLISSEDNLDYINMSTIPDINKIPKEYQSSVKNMYSVGIFSGMPDGTFSGSTSVTRAQISMIIARIIDKTERIAYDLNYNSNVKGQEGNFSMSLGNLVYDDFYSYHVVSAGPGIDKTNVIKRNFATGKSEVIYKGSGYIDSLCLKDGYLYFIDNVNAAYDTNDSTIYMTSNSIIVQYNLLNNTAEGYYKSDKYSSFGSFTFYGDAIYVTQCYSDNDIVKIKKITKTIDGINVSDILEFENEYHSVDNPFISIFDNKLYYYERENTTKEDYSYITRIVEYDLKNKSKNIITQCENIDLKYIIVGNMLYLMAENEGNKTIYKYNLVTDKNFTKDKKAIYSSDKIENFSVVEGTIYITLYDSNSIFKLLNDRTLVNVLNCDQHPLIFVLNKGKIYYSPYGVAFKGEYRIADSNGKFSWLFKHLNINQDSYNTAVVSLLESSSSYKEYDTSGDVKYISYSWTYPSNTDWTFETMISKSLYNKYKKMSRDVGILSNGLKDYSYFIMNPDDDYLMYKYVSYFKKAAEEENFDTNESIQFITCFVQSIEYISDSIGSGYDEYEKFPIETLFDQGGDCEDSSILLASLLKEMNIDCVMILLPEHMAVGVACDPINNGYYYQYDGKKYYYIETTNTGWELGKMPTQLINEKAIVIPIN